MELLMVQLLLIPPLLCWARAKADFSWQVSEVLGGWLLWARQLPVERLLAAAGGDAAATAVEALADTLVVVGKLSKEQLLSRKLMWVESQLHWLE